MNSPANTWVRGNGAGLNLLARTHPEASHHTAVRFRRTVPCRTKFLQELNDSGGLRRLRQVQRRLALSVNLAGVRLLFEHGLRGRCHRQ